MTTTAGAAPVAATPHGERLSFCVLGPLELHRGTAAVRLPGRQERALLALLLTAPGRVLSVSAIVRGLWGERAPAGADKTVQSYVSRLRRALPDDAGALVRTRSPGYLLAVDAQDVDAERFRRLVDAARSGDAGHDRVQRLRTALDLWRGDAYGEFRAPFAEVERAALEELRLVAHEDLAEAELLLGAGPELVGGLEALLADHPLRERLWASLMTALYRAGRQSDALRAYQRARSTLVEELGVEPGPDLRAVERAVLAQDPVLLGRGQPEAAPVVVRVPRPAFIGRRGELSALVDAYACAERGVGRRVLLTGGRGTGKSRLLAELAQEVRRRGVTLADGAAGPARSPALLALDDLHRLTALDLRALLAQLPDGGPTLVVGACVVDDLDEERCAALSAAFCERLALPPLSEAEVASVVQLYVPADAVARATASPEVVAAAGVPLLVHAAASRFAEELVGSRVASAALAVAPPRRDLEASTRRLAESVTELQRLSAVRSAQAAPVTARAVCPFKGLTFFDVADAPYYAGRGRLVAQLVARLVDAPLLAVVGASGSGKSSVLRAGLVAAVRDGLLPGSDRWSVVVTSPSEPLPAIGHGTRTLLVVDQLEELFTALPARARSNCASWLASTAVRPDVTVVVALRSDYYGSLAAHPELAELVSANTVLVSEMSPEELRQAIVLPSAAAGLELETGLAEQLVAEVAGQPGALPLVSTALLSLWERRDGVVLTTAAHCELGGVRTAVARLAEAAYGRLDDEQRRHARRLLLRLADVGENGQPVRRRVPLAEVGADAASRAVLDVLADRRLLTVSETHVEVAHEALLREWPRLRGWLDEDAYGRELRRHLAPTAAGWQAAGHDPAELYRGPRLAAAGDWAREHDDDLTDLERRFLSASQSAADLEAAHRRRSIRRLRVLASGLATVLVAAVGATWAAVDQRDDVVAASLRADVRALRSAALGEARWDRALLYAVQAHRLEPSAASHTALLQAVQRSPEATGLFDADQRLLQVAVSEDGDTLAALGSEGAVYAWDLATRRRTATVTGLTYFGGTSFDLSQDGRRVAVVGVPIADDAASQGYASQAVVVDLSAVPVRSRVLPGPAVTSAMFTQDGATLLTSGADGTLRYVDVDTGAERRRVAAARTSGSAVLAHAHGRRFAVTSDAQAVGPVTVWDVAQGRRTWSSEQQQPATAAVSPDGRAVAVATADGRVEVVDVGTGQRRPVLGGASGGLTDVSWSPDGSTLAGALPDGSVAVWDTASLRQRAVLRGHSGAVSSVTFTADGRTLLASGFDRSVLAWDTAGRTGAVSVVVDALPAQTVAHSVSADATLAATLQPDGDLRLVDGRTGESSLIELPALTGVQGLYVHPRGRYVGLVQTAWPDGVDGHLRVVDVRARAVLPYTVPLVAEMGFDAAFAADSPTVVVAGGREVRAWDVRTGRPVRAAYEAAGAVVSLAVTPDGEQVALSLDRKGVEVADLVAGRRVVAVDPPQRARGTALHPLAWAPDGSRLAAGSDSGEVTVWDTRSWRARSHGVALQGGRVDTLLFSADSRSLVAGGAGSASFWDVAQAGVGRATLGVDPARPDAPVTLGLADSGGSLTTLTGGSGLRVWQVASDRLRDHACRVAGRDLTRQEWQLVLPGRRYQPTCPSYARPRAARGPEQPGPGEVSRGAGSPSAGPAR